MAEKRKTFFLILILGGIGGIPLGLYIVETNIQFRIGRNMIPLFICASFSSLDPSDQELKDFTTIVFLAMFTATTSRINMWRNIFTPIMIVGLLVCMTIGIIGFIIEKRKQ